MANSSFSSFVGGGGITWNATAVDVNPMVVDNGYITTSGSLVTLTLPTTAAVGKVIEVAGQGAGLWQIAQNASQLINFGDLTSTTGTGGSIASTNANDSVALVCTVVDTTWTVRNAQGVISVV